MVSPVLVTQLRYAWRSGHLRVTTIGYVTAVATVILVSRPEYPTDLIELVTWTQLIGALVAGSCLTGWRVAQWPKSRAMEFHLVTPLSDWDIVAGEIGAGMLRTLLVMATTVPGIVALWGAGWIGIFDACVMFLLPLLAGWLAGIVLATVAYEPLRIRRLLERLVLVAILGYLVLFGLLGNYFVPLLFGRLSQWTGVPTSTFADIGLFMRYFNPFRLLDSVGHSNAGSLFGRAMAIATMLLIMAALGLCRLTRRLRPHYYEENYGRQLNKKDYRQRIRENPLAWWTRRRVSRFKGNVNLYLAWTTIGLYVGWMLLGSRWPSWLAANQLRLLEHLGGASLLAVSALQLAVVPTAFLNGLWDSNTTQRAERLELLLVTPLAPRHFLQASVAAAWTRGRGYVAGAVVMWIAAALTDRISWFTCLGLCVIAANYLLLSVAVAFRNFARLATDHSVTVHGLLWSVGLPLLTIGCMEVCGPTVAAAMPLGGLYVLSLPWAEQTQLSGLSQPAWWTLVGGVNLIYLLISVGLIRSALAGFDREMRHWFSNHLISQQPASTVKAKLMRRWMRTATPAAN